MAPQLTLDVHIAPDYRRQALEADVRAGLLATPKSLPPVWFYDQRGSELFDEITRLPEYYLTRAEHEILRDHAARIVDLAGADTLVELGSGTSEKTRTLLDAMAAAGQLRRFVPFDVSPEILALAAEDIAGAYGVEVRAVVGDFHHHLDRLPRGGARLIAFLGSTIGNLDPGQRRRFLTDLEATMGPADTLLLGTDLVKDPARLVAAYDDRAGVTAAFNRNVLNVLNNELGANFPLATFAHVAVWDPEARWIEMRLRATRAVTVDVKALDLQVDFAPGEEMRTEISSKFTPSQVEEELAEAGFGAIDGWTDRAGDFLLTLAQPRAINLR
jgi:L-histidine N-alpha-methyltransferase